jgi:hypothetical protein
MATYDPSKRYTWTPDDKFELSGAEFGLILNTLRSILSTEEAARILLANQASEVIEGIMAKAVESDIIKEAPEAPKSSL